MSLPLRLPLPLILGILGSSSLIQAKDLRILEITGEARQLLASVEFLADKAGDTVLKTQATGGRSFDWLDIPEEARAVRIRVGELATVPVDLAPSGTTLVELGQPALIQDDKGLPLAVLSSQVKTDRVLAPEGADGWVFFGSLKPDGGGNSNPETWTWSSLYLVLPPKAPLDPENADTLAAVKSNAEGKRLRVDFPLILRKADATGAILRSKDDKTIRAGQYVHVKTLKKPDEKGNVYAEVEVVAEPGGNP